MNIKQTIKTLIFTIALGVGIVASVAPSPVGAVCSNTGKDTCNNGCGVDTAIIKCDNVDVTKGGTENNGVWSLLLTGINILTAGVGVAAVGGIVYASILYTTASGNTEQTKKALDFIRNVVIGVVAYAAMFAFLNFIIPGGLFAS